MYHLTLEQEDLVSRFGEDSAGLTFDGITVGTGVGGTSIHNDLIGIQGGDIDEYYHLDYNEFNLLTNDKDADTLHTHDHNLLRGIQGGDPSDDDIYHLSSSNIDDLHTHSNKEVLDLFDEDSSGLIWSGEAIQGGTGTGNTYFPSGWN
jgi:hypothetical protein